MLGARTMNGSEFQAYHVREAARLRRLIANATTPAVKTRLIEQAEEHERLAEGFDEDAEFLPITQIDRGIGFQIGFNSAAEAQLFEHEFA
jgi:hypothetical protein